MTAIDVLIPVLDEVGERWHPSFQKPLLKMLTHYPCMLRSLVCYTWTPTLFCTLRLIEIWYF